MTDFAQAFDQMTANHARERALLLRGAYWAWWRECTREGTVYQQPCSASFEAVPFCVLCLKPIPKAEIIRSVRERSGARRRTGRQEGHG